MQRRRRRLISQAKGRRKYTQAGVIWGFLPFFMGKRVLHGKHVRVCQRKGDKVMWETIKRCWPPSTISYRGCAADRADPLGRSAADDPDEGSAGSASSAGAEVDDQERGGRRGEVTSFGALCTALSATIGTGNIVGVATAICGGGPGAVFWMVVAAFLGMATKYSEGLLAVSTAWWMRTIMPWADRSTT